MVRPLYGIFLPESKYLNIQITSMQLLYFIVVTLIKLSVDPKIKLLLVGTGEMGNKPKENKPHMQILSDKFQEFPRLDL